MITIFVAKLDFGVTEQELLDAFGQYGKVAKVNLAKDRETGKPRGFAFVEMPNQNEAQAAIEALDGKVFNGRSCVVKQADDRPAGSKPPQRSDSGFKPRTDSRPQQRTDFNEKSRDDAPPFRPKSDDDDDTPAVNPLKVVPKKKLTPTKKVEIDTTNDGKSKKPKMNAYKKSGKDNVFFDDDDDLDEDIDLFGRSEEDEDLDDEALSKYLVNADDDDEFDDDEEYDDEDYDEEEYDDED